MAATASFILASFSRASAPSRPLSPSYRLHPCTLRRTTSSITTTSTVRLPFSPRRRTLTTNLSPPQPSDSKSQQPTNMSKSDVPEEERGQPSPPPPLPSEVKKSLALFYAEVFLGIASRLVKTFRRKPGEAPGSELGTSSADSVSVGETSLPIWKDSVNMGGNSRERIGKVVEDPLEPGMIWQQRMKDVEAEERRNKVTSPGFSFSAAGLLFPYHVGVAQCLIEKGYIKETTPLAGSSAGAIICAVIACGKSMEETLQVTKELADDCRLNGTAFRLGAVLREVLERMLPDDAHIKCNGRVRVAVTQLLWRPKGLLVDQFDSKEDLINAVITSSFVPGYLAPRPATMFRNRLCVDGGLTLFMPPTSAAHTVRVCAFPVSTLRLQGIDISPDRNPENRPSTRQLFNWALEPAEEYLLDKLFEYGYMDASVWAEQNPVDSTVEEEEV